KAAVFWGRAGKQSLARSAFVETEEQLRSALNQIAALPVTPALRQEEIDLQVRIITPLMHIKGTALETKSAIERARLLIEQAEASGEPPEDPLLLFSVLSALWTFALWTSSTMASAGEAARALAGQMLELAEKQRSRVPLLMAHCNMGFSMLLVGETAKSVEH